MKIFWISLVLLFTQAHAECPLPVPADNHGLKTLLEDSDVIVVTARPKNDPCRYENLLAELPLTKKYGCAVHAFERRPNCPTDGSECFEVEKTSLIVGEGIASLSIRPDSDDLVIDIQSASHCGKETGNTNTTLPTRFSIGRSSILDAQGKVIRRTCNPPSCLSYEIKSATSKNILYLVTTQADGSVERQFIVNTGDGSNARPDHAYKSGNAEENAGERDGKLRRCYDSEE